MGSSSEYLNYHQAILQERNGRPEMLRWALIFLVVALIAGVLGFANIAGTSMVIAKWLAIIFVVLFLVSLVIHLVRGRAP